MTDFIPGVTVVKLNPRHNRTESHPSQSLWSTKAFSVSILIQTVSTVEHLIMSSEVQCLAV